MIMRSLSAFLVALVFAFSQAKATVPISSDELLDIRPSQDPSVLALYCQISGKTYYQSRVALLQSPDAKYDYGITTAHGLVHQDGHELENCYVRDFSGGQFRLEKSFIPANYLAGSSSDWAIISLKKIKSKALLRYSLPAFSDNVERQIRGSATTVTFPSGRGLGFNGQVCLALPGAFAGVIDENILVHDCKAISGQSGSPISTTYGSEDVLLGIHLGKSFVIKSPITKKPEYLGFFRFADQALVAEITIVVRSLHNEP